MRIIGFDKESRPVLYFCVLSSVGADGLFPQNTYYANCLLLKLLEKALSQKDWLSFGPKKHKVVVIVSQMCWVREVSRSLENLRVFDA